MPEFQAVFFLQALGVDQLNQNTISTGMGNKIGKCLSKEVLPEILMKF